MYKDFKNILRDNLEVSLKETLIKSLKPFINDFVKYGVLNLEISLNNEHNIYTLVYDNKFKIWRDLFHHDFKGIKEDKKIIKIDKEIRKFCIKYKKELFYSSNIIIIDFLEIK